MAGLATHQSAEPDTLVVRIDFDERDLFLEDAPNIYYVTDYYRTYPVVLVRLSRLDQHALARKIAYAVSQRTHEIGIRMALGALPSTILKSVLGGALLYMIAGLSIGLIGAWGLAGLVRGFLFEIQPHDPTVYAGVLAVLAIAGLTAAFVSARHAAGVDPLIALRME